MLRAVTLALSLASATARTTTGAAVSASTFHRARASIVPSSRRCAPSIASTVGYRCAASDAAADAESSPESSSYEVHAVAGDGRCLFRSVAVARSLRDRGERTSESEEIREADALRSAAVEELNERREETEWFIEGDFEQYCRRMKMPSTWGGEPEILMLTHVLTSPISVYMESEEGARNIGRYGDEYDGDEEDLAVLFHGAGHYEALRVL